MSGQQRAEGEDESCDLDGGEELTEEEDPEGGCREGREQS